MSVDAFATLPHYVDHLAPIWHALPDRARGTFIAGGDLIARHLEDRHNITAEVIAYPRGRRNTVLVAGYRDILRARSPRYILVEHGTGQTYNGSPDDRSYAGGAGREPVILNLAPNELVAAANRAAYPNTPTAVVGVPKLDPWHPPARTRPAGDPTIALAWHWDCRIVPECRPAWHHYADHLELLAGAFGPENILGHGHPRAWQNLPLASVYRRLGIRVVKDFAEVLTKADLLIADNTSALYEFASTGRPVLVLNAPWYRRDVHHGLRFWDLIPGLQIDHPLELVDAAVIALEDPDHLAERRQTVIDTVYPLTDGNAAKRAAEEVQNV